jgi:hypothetical protein
VDDAREIKQIINNDHREMCRFGGKKDQGYKMVYQAIDGYVRILKENPEREEKGA